MTFAGSSKKGFKVFMPNFLLPQFCLNIWYDSTKKKRSTLSPYILLSNFFHVFFGDQVSRPPSNRSFGFVHIITLTHFFEVQGVLVMRCTKGMTLLA